MAALSLNKCCFFHFRSSTIESISNYHVSHLQPSKRRRRWPEFRVSSGSRADDSSSAPFEMSVESALKLLGVSEGASFDEILRAKKAIIDNCRDDQDTIAQVEAAYDMLLMQSLTQRRAGKVVSSSIRYADVKPISSGLNNSLPQWLQTRVKSVPFSIGTPSNRDFGIQAGIFGTLMLFTYASGTFTSAVGNVYTGADVPGIILATSFGASLYFSTKKRNSLVPKAPVLKRERTSQVSLPSWYYSHGFPGSGGGRLVPKPFPHICDYQPGNLTVASGTTVEAIGQGKTMLTWKNAVQAYRCVCDLRFGNTSDFERPSNNKCSMSGLKGRAATNDLRAGGGAKQRRANLRGRATFRTAKFQTSKWVND